MRKIFAALVSVMAACGYTCAFSPGLDITPSDIRTFATALQNYEQLMARMDDGQELFPQEWAYLYYGYSYTDSYQYGAEPLSEMYILNLAESEQYDLAWGQCNWYLQVCPFSMLALEAGIFLADYMNDMETADIYYKRSGHILKVIEALGDGSKEYPFQVVFNGDINYYLKYQIAADQYTELPQKDGRREFEVVLDGEKSTVWFAFDMCRKNN